MAEHLKRKNILKRLFNDERGAVLLITTVYMPVIVGFLSLAVDMSYVYRSISMLQSAADAAALSAVDDALENTLSFGNSCNVAKSYATKNLAVAQYGNVLKQNTGDCSDVVQGNWALTNSCPDALTGTNYFCAGGTINAVKVTTRMAAANGNALALAFISAVVPALANFNVSATAIATYGQQPGATPLTVGLVQDVSTSFLQEIGNAKAADQLLANCLLNAAAGSKFGISVFGVTAMAPFENGQAIVVQGNSSSLTSDINGIHINSNGSADSTTASGSGTDIAAGINSANNQICPGSSCSPPPTAFKPAIVLVTDGLPNHCNGQPCSTSQAQQAAVTAANNAAANGFDIYAIYYCNDGTGTCNSSANQQAATFLQGLVRGDGKFAKTPTPQQFAQLMGSTVCKSVLKPRLVW